MRKLSRMTKKWWFWLLVLCGVGAVIYATASPEKKEEYKAMLSNIPLLNKIV